MNRRKMMACTGAAVLGTTVARAADSPSEENTGLKGVPTISVEELVAEMRKEGFQWRYIGRQITFTAVVTTAGAALRVRIEGMDNGKAEAAVLHPRRYENSATVGQKVKVRGLLTDQCYGVWQVWCYEISVINEPGAAADGGGV